jgi:NAD+ kinase
MSANQRPSSVRDESGGAWRTKIKDKFSDGIKEPRMGSIDSVGLVLHPERYCPEVVHTILDWARPHGTEVLGVSAEVSRYGAPIRPVSRGELGERPDVLVSLGGDGTMLRALRIAYKHRLPVLGVNLGRLGFLPEIDPPDLDAALCSIDSGRFTVETRSGLCVNGKDGHGVVAFNDLALIRVPGYAAMAAIEVQVEGHPFVRYLADAVIVATPTGSTAYSFSAGGPIVSPHVDGLLVTPVAPHSAFNRALFLAQGEKLALHVLPDSGKVALEVDGALSHYGDPDELLDITVEPAAARVVRLGQTTFYERAQRKLTITGSPQVDSRIKQHSWQENPAPEA